MRLELKEDAVGEALGGDGGLLATPCCSWGLSKGNYENRVVLRPLVLLRSISFLFLKVRRRRGDWRGI